MNINKHIISKLASILLVSGLFVFNNVLANTNDLNTIISQAQAQINHGDNASAYSLLKKHELKLAGNSQYDLMLGTTALAVDEPTIAVFAFERCLLIQPNNQDCQSGMARAHIELNETEPAYQLINQLDQQSNEYQDLLSDFRRVLLKQQDHDTRFSMWLQGGIGYDSNANTATLYDNVFLPDLGTLPLRRDYQRKESFFNQTMLGISYSTPINSKWRFLTDGLIRHKNNWQVHDYDKFITNARIGVQRNHNGHSITLRAIGQYYNLGGHSYRNTVGATGQYSYSLNQNTEIGGFVQYSHMHYPHSSYRDSNRTVAGLSGSHQFLQSKAMLYGSLYGGRDAVSDTDHRHLSYDLGGLQIGSTWLIAPKTRLDLNAAYEHRRYDNQEPLFKKQRRDNQISTRLGLVYAINRRLSIRPAYEYIHAESSIPLRHYSRHIISFNVRYALF